MTKNVDSIACHFLSNTFLKNLILKVEFFLPLKFIMEEKERRGYIVGRKTDQAEVTAILECREESNRWGNGGKSANRDRKKEL